MENKENEKKLSERMIEKNLSSSFTYNQCILKQKRSTEVENLTEYSHLSLA